MSTEPESAAAPETGEFCERPPIDLSQYRVLVAGSFAGSAKELVALAGMGVAVRVVAKVTTEIGKRLEVLPLDEFISVDSDEQLLVEAFRRASSVNLVVLAGEKADMLERTLLPLLQECAASSLDDLLPLVRLDDPALRFLRTGRRWGFYLVGRALGLPPETARAYMEDCCGYEKQNQDRQ